MLHQIASHLAQKRLQRKIHPAARTLEEQTYYIELLLESMITLSVLLISALFLHLFIETFTFILFFMWFRGNTGGFHTKTTIGCSILSIIVALSASCIAKYWTGNEWILPAAAFFSYTVIFLFAPVNHPELALSSHEIIQCRKIARRISFISAFILTIMSVFKIGPTIIRSAVLAILTTALSIVMAKILRQEVSEYETNEN